MRIHQRITKHLLCSLVFLTGSSFAAQKIPQQLIGKWLIQRELPARTISCWGEKEAKLIIGTELEYTANSFRWNHLVTKNPTVALKIIRAEQFERDNSSPSVNGSQVSFRQLGLSASKATQVKIDHAPAEITENTSEIPGDLVLLKNRNTIVFSVCNLYFEANRFSSRK
jgi:hypothetical protein